MNTNSQGHSLTLVQGHSDSTFSNFFSLETSAPIEAKFLVDPPWDGGRKFCLNGPGHMTKMAAISICGKNLKKNLLLRNQEAYDLETSLILLYGKKGKTMDFSETIVVFDVKVGRCS